MGGCVKGAIKLVSIYIHTYSRNPLHLYIVHNVYELNVAYTNYEDRICVFVYGSVVLFMYAFGLLHKPQMKRGHRGRIIIICLRYVTCMVYVQVWKHLLHILICKQIF